MARVWGKNGAETTGKIAFREACRSQASGLQTITENQEASLRRQKNRRLRHRFLSLYDILCRAN
jgi:hypothetical protein